MRTYLACLPCFFRQVLESGKLIGLDDASIKSIIDAVGDELKRFPLQSPPPVMARLMQRMFVEKSGVSDPYREVKRESNRQALSVLDDLRLIVRNSGNPLRTAVELACAGNIIDYGVFSDGVDVEAEIEGILRKKQETAACGSRDLFAFAEFIEALGRAKKLVYVGDNAGEIVFDRVLLEVIAEQYPAVDLYFAVRGEPILNDALAEDALQCGIGRVATIVSSGVSSPGLILEEADPEFLDLYRSADLIVSKGQGNYEALSEAAGPIFFLFITKCEVIMRDAGSAMRELVLIRNRRD